MPNSPARNHLILIRNSEKKIFLLKLTMDVTIAMYMIVSMHFAD